MPLAEIGKIRQDIERIEKSLAGLKKEELERMRARLEVIRKELDAIDKSIIMRIEDGN